MKRRMDAATLFAFDFIVEKLSDVQKLDQIQGVAFKLLDYPTVPVPLTNTHSLAERRPSDVPARCSVKLNKGKSVVFEMNPNELSLGLGETPVEILLLTSGAAEDDTRPLLPSQLSPSPIVGRGELDLSHVAAHLDAAVKHLHACRLHRKPDTVETRHTVECMDSDGRAVARVRVKCRLACIPGRQKKGNVSNEIKNRVSDKENTTTAAQLKCQEMALEPPVRGIAPRDVCSGVTHIPGKEKEKRKKSKLESAEERNGRPLLQECKLSYPPFPVTSHELACNYENTCEKLGGGYVPNLVCPPPLYYHSEIKAKEHLHSETLSCNSTNESAGHAGVYFDGIAQAESRDHWSVVARYDHASHPLTTQYEDLPIQDATRSNETAAVSIQQETSQRHLPLLSGLLQELASLQANTKSFQQAKKSPDTISTFVQTENVEQKVEQSKKGSKIKTASHRTLTSHRIPRSRLMRECCQPKKAQGKLVPRGKSVIYPPDIKRKCRKYRVLGKMCQIAHFWKRKGYTSVHSCLYFPLMLGSAVVDNIR